MDSDIFHHENVFITGPGGTGKSYSIREIANHAQSQNVNIHITSTTGISAVAINGMTIHKWGGIGISTLDEVDIVVNKINTRNPDCRSRWKKCEILVIDEISMLSADTFDLLNIVGQNIRRNSKPFGGIQIILTGDFMQISPVKGTFAFRSQIWDSLNMQTILLSTPHRFTDSKYFEMLQRIRIGKQSPEDVEILQSRVKAYHEHIANYNSGQIKPTCMFSVNSQVDSYNQKELNLLPGQIFTFSARDKILHASAKNESQIVTKKSTKTSTSGVQLGVRSLPTVKLSQSKKDEYTELLNTMVPNTLQLKVGAQVMLTRNICVENKLANGSRGIVVNCTNAFVDVKFMDEQVHSIVAYDYEYEDNTVYMKRTQIPLVLCFATSIHKSQGFTLDFICAKIDQSVFNGSMSYVALSRVRSLDGLLLSGFDPRKMYPNPDSLAFEKELGLIDE